MAESTGRGETQRTGAEAAITTTTEGRAGRGLPGNGFPFDLVERDWRTSLLSSEMEGKVLNCN